MSRPRPSILAQFDPLLSEAEPDCSDSEEEFDPEKENVAPSRNELTMTTFFNRTYKRDYAQPAALTRRLIDVGDVTLALEEDEEEEVEKEEVENGVNLSFNVETPKRAETVRVLPRSTPRTPLADIALEHKPTPKFIQKTTPKPLASTARPDPRTDPVSSLTSLIESVNLAGTNFGHVHRADTYVSPRITVDRPDAENLATSTLLETTAPFTMPSPYSSQHDLSDASENNMLAPPSSTATSSNRMSLDLQSSFHLQLQSETSFDLLNDRISFLDVHGKGMASFFNALDEDSSDEEKHGDDREEVDSEADVATTAPCSPSPSESSDENTPVQELETVRKARSQVCASPVFPSSQLTQCYQPAESKMSPESSPQSVLAPLIRQSSALVTPAVHRTAANTVPALRIVKRTKRYDDERPSSSASVTSASSSGSTATNVVSRKPSPPLVSAAGSNVTRSSGTARVVAGENPMKAMPRAPLPKAGANGPRRVLLPDSNAPTKPTVNSGKPTLGRPKVAVPSLGPAPAKSGPTASGVPRPVASIGNGPMVSRLPAPSGIARFGRKNSAPTSTEVSGSGNRTAPSRGLPRRYATYGQ